MKIYVTTIRGKTVRVETLRTAIYHSSSPIDAFTSAGIYTLAVEFPDAKVKVRIRHNFVYHLIILIDI